MPAPEKNLAISSHISRLWWVTIPLFSRRLSIKFPHTLLDGFYLNVWPIVAAIVPPIVLLLGFITGWLHPDFKVVFSESIPLLMIITILGTLSANLGFAFLMGFVLGDVFLGQSFHELLLNPLRSGLPLLIGYAVMAMLITKLPITIKMLVAELKIPGIGLKVRFAIAALLHVLLTGLLVYFWTQAVPVLIRPLFTWKGSIPTIQAMAPLQQYGMVIVVTAMVTSVFRMILQGLIAFKVNFGSRLDPLQETLVSAPLVKAFPNLLNKWILLLITSIWSCFLLAGAYQSILDAIVIGSVSFILLGIRKGLIPISLGYWTNLMQRIPLLLRLGVGFLIVRYLSKPLLADLMRNTQTFRPVLLIIVISMIIIFLLNPLSASSKKGVELKNEK